MATEVAIWGRQAGTLNGKNVKMGVPIGNFLKEATA
jgi:hypothetical protein